MQKGKFPVKVVQDPDWLLL